jgi:hypothetical protein
MQKLTVRDGVPAPGDDESWAELAEHSVEHDDVDHPREPRPPDPAMPAVI